MIAVGGGSTNFGSAASMDCATWSSVADKGRSCGLSKQ